LPPLNTSEEEIEVEADEDEETTYSGALNVGHSQSNGNCNTLKID
jgi:hypothetical protein